MEGWIVVSSWAHQWHATAFCTLRLATSHLQCGTRPRPPRCTPHPTNGVSEVRLDRIEVLDAKATAELADVHFTKDGKPLNAGATLASVNAVNSGINEPADSEVSAVDRRQSGPRTRSSRGRFPAGFSARPPPHQARNTDGNTYQARQPASNSSSNGFAAASGNSSWCDNHKKFGEQTKNCRGNGCPLAHMGGNATGARR